MTMTISMHFEPSPHITSTEYEQLKRAAQDLNVPVFMQTHNGNKSIVPAHLFVPDGERKKKIDFVCWPKRN